MSILPLTPWQQSTIPEILRLDDLALETSENSFFWPLQGKIIQVRGFWYPLSSQEGILAPQPHLKSCCLKAPAKIEQQLLVKGSLDSLPAQRVITLEGIFKIDPRYNSEGALIQLFVLEQAREVPQTSLHLGPIVFGACMIFLCIGLVFFKRKFLNIF
jgi:hypothetical protein